MRTEHGASARSLSETLPRKSRWSGPNSVRTRHDQIDIEFLRLAQNPPGGGIAHAHRSDFPGREERLEGGGAFLGHPMRPGDLLLGEVPGTTDVFGRDASLRQAGPLGPGGEDICDADDDGLARWRQGGAGQVGEGEFRGLGAVVSEDDFHGSGAEWTGSVRRRWQRGGSARKRVVPAREPIGGKQKLGGEAEPMLHCGGVELQGLVQEKRHQPLRRDLHHAVELRLVQRRAVVANLENARARTEQVHQEILRRDGILRVVGLAGGFVPGEDSVVDGVFGLHGVSALSPTHPATDRPPALGAGCRKPATR